MQVFAFAPLPVGVLVWNDPDPCLTVITKLTLSYRSGGLVIAEEQEPLCRALPSLVGSAEELHHPDDFVPRKARCDVLLSGSAYAATPLPAIVARISVGSFQKRFVALAGESATAIPLAAAYLRRRRAIDAEPVTVGALSGQHPERAPYAPLGDLDASTLRRRTLPRDFDFGFFNAAPRDQQIAPVLAGTALSLEGLSPGGVPASGQLPGQWPQIYALSREGRLIEIPLICDAIWIDTDRNVCELSLRGTLRAAAASREPPLPMGLAIRLRDVARRQGPMLLADLPGATQSRAIYAEEALQLTAEDDGIEEIDPETYVTEDTTGPKIVEEVTADIPAPRPVEARPRRPITLTMTEPAALGGALPFAPRSAGLAAFDALKPSPPSAPPSPAPAPPPTPAAPPQRSHAGTPFRRPPTLDIQPGALGQAVLPFLNARPPAPPPDLPEVTPPARTIGESMLEAPPPAVRSEPALALTEPLAETSVPLETYAAVKVEIWGDREPVVPVLMRHGIDEVAWYENERRLAQLLAREAREGGTRLAMELQRALRAARDERPVDLEWPLHAFENTYLKLLAAIDLADDPSSVIASKGVTVAEWRNIRRRFLARAEADTTARDALVSKLAAARKAAGDDGSPPAEPKRWLQSEPAPPGAKRVVSRKPG